MAHPTNHVIDITRSSETETETSPHDTTSVSGIGFGGGNRLLISHSSSNESNSRTRRGDSRGRESQLNPSLWISFEFVFTVSKIIASVVVLSLSRDEHPRAPLFAWIVGYALGCVASLPSLCWRYVPVQDSSQGSPRIDDPSGTLLSTSTTNQGEENATVVAASSRSNQASWLMNTRLKLLMEYFRVVVDCFFGIWFVIGCLWIFGGHSSVNDAPNLYMLCLTFLMFSCVSYAVPFVLCVTVCCCLPCIISARGVREDLTQTRGATSESINALPTYKYKLKKSKSISESNSTVSEGGIVAEGTEKERAIFGEDAVCCVCLAKYEDDDGLRELPCSHLFHKDCIDKWLKINALCPLCKSEVGENITS